MDSQYVLKSFQYFSEKVLPKALSTPDFNEESIANAFLWAEFCEKLYERLDGENLKKLKEHACAHPEMYLGYENLQQCSTALCHAFLQNPSIDRNFLKDVLSRIKPSDFSFSEIWDDAVELNQLSFNLIESLKPIAFKESDLSLYYEVKSELFVNFLKDLSNQLLTEGQAETLFNHLFETLCNDEDSMSVLLHILMRDDPQDSHIQALAIHWVLLKLMEGPECRLACLLWRQNPSHLRVLTATHPSLLSCYLNFLTKCSLTPMDGRPQMKMATCVALLTQDEVLKHFKVLMSCHDDVARCTLAHLSTLAQSDEQSALWKDILSAVM